MLLHHQITLSHCQCNAAASQGNAVICSNTTGCKQEPQAMIAGTCLSKAMMLLIGNSVQRLTDTSNNG
jgi:hypothetical protein